MLLFRVAEQFEPGAVNAHCEAAAEDGPGGGCDAARAAVGLEGVRRRNVVGIRLIMVSSCVCIELVAAMDDPGF